MIINIYAVYKKHKNDENWRSNQRKITSFISSARIILLLSVIHTYEIAGSQDSLAGRSFCLAKWGLAQEGGNPVQRVLTFNLPKTLPSKVGKKNFFNIYNLNRLVQKNKGKNI